MKKEEDSVDYTNCSHLDSTAFSGDLICLNCGKVLQSNSQLSLDPVYLDRDTNRHSSQGVIPRQLITHQEREESSLRFTARKLISSFALKPAYEVEALELMHKYWVDSEAKQKYGISGNRLLIAAIFLLARRDHLAVNLGLLAATIDSSAQECGALFDPLIKLDPGLRSLARVSDYTERAVDLMVSLLKRLYGLQIIEAHLHSLKQKSESIGLLFQDTETGSSKSAEAVALAASSLALSALLLHDSHPISLDDALLPQICDAANVPFKSVKVKRAALIAKLQERADALLPSLFSVKMTRQRKQALLLQHLDLLCE